MATRKPKKAVKRVKDLPMAKAKAKGVRGGAADIFAKLGVDDRTAVVREHGVGHAVGKTAVRGVHQLLKAKRQRALEPVDDQTGTGNEARARTCGPHSTIEGLPPPSADGWRVASIRPP